MPRFMLYYIRAILKFSAVMTLQILHSNLSRFYVRDTCTYLSTPYLTLYTKKKIVYVLCAVGSSIKGYRYVYCHRLPQSCRV